MNTNAISGDDALRILDDLDEIVRTMRPRYCGHPTMDGRYPCWIVWLPKVGTCERKSLKEAVIEFATTVADAMVTDATATPTTATGGVATGGVATTP